MRKPRHVLPLVLIIAGASLLAQSLAFEVASVKPVATTSGFQQVGVQPGGRFTALNVPLRQLIRIAYGLEDVQLLGGPDWVASTRFEISAVAGRDVTRDEAVTMLRALLADRFKLVVHSEARQLPIYELTLARSDSRLGPQLRRAGADCARLTLPAGVPPPPPPPAGAGPFTPLGVGAALRCPSMFAPGWISGRDLTIAQLATRLAQDLARPVINRTGLTGTFDIDMSYTPDVGAAAAQGPFVASDAPALFTALQEQLGLKLEPARGPVAVVVIDRVERPTEN